MSCKEARRVLEASVDAMSASESVEEHLEACPACAEEWLAFRANWRSLGLFAAPDLGEAANARMRRMLASDLMARRRRSFTKGLAKTRDIPFSPPGWAVVATAVLLGLGVGGWLGLGALELLDSGEPSMPAAHASLLDVAEQIFDAAPPGTPAAAWLGEAPSGEDS